LQTAGIDHIVTSRVHRFQTAAELVFSICTEEDCAAAGCFALIMWTVWKNINDKVWNDTKEPGRSIGIKALQQWQQWCSVQQHSQSSSQQQQHPIAWQKPPMDWYKCNVDAGFHKELNRITAGWCVRNHVGNFVMAGTLWQEGHLSVIEGEAYALLEALKAMQQQGLSQVIFETDSKNVVDAIHNIHGGASEFSSIICNINRMLLANPNFVVKFIKRKRIWLPTR
jgi:hypothetical protein